MRIYLLLLFVLMITRAQATNVIFDRITMDSGLFFFGDLYFEGSYRVCLVGTTEGLNRYDGYTFKSILCPYRIVRKVYKAVLSINYSRIQMEVSGSFSSGGISRYDRGSDTF